jgi:hypothetical protein
LQVKTATANLYWVKDGIDFELFRDSELIQSAYYDESMLESDIYLAVYD